MQELQTEWTLSAFKSTLFGMENFILGTNKIHTERATGPSVTVQPNKPNEKLRFMEPSKSPFNLSDKYITHPVAASQ